MSAKPRAVSGNGLRSAALPALAMMLFAGAASVSHAEATDPVIQPLTDILEISGSKTTRLILTSGKTIVGRIVRIDGDTLLVRRPSAGLLPLTMSEIDGVKIKAPSGEFLVGKLQTMTDGGIGWLAEADPAAEQDVAAVATRDQPDKGGPLIRLDNGISTGNSLPIRQDTADAGDGERNAETADVELAKLEAPAVSPPDAADTSKARLTVETEEISESGKLIYFRLKLSEPASRSILIIYTMIDGSASAPADYTHRQGVIVFEPGQTEAVVATSVIDDETPEDTETFTFFVTGDPANVLVEERKVTASIADDDG
ncbi:MAG: Calx-beta domain-containing protein [Pseudomonadota bacterium]